MNTLIVNYAYEPIQVVGWEKAIYLMVTGKADLLVGYDRIVRSVSLTLQLPKVVRLRKYVRMKLRDCGVYRKREVFERDGWECQYCGLDVSLKTATIDHVQPRSKGGTTSFENTVTACATCNSKKADKTPELAGMVLARRPFKPKTTSAVRLDLQTALEKYLGNE